MKSLLLLFVIASALPCAFAQKYRKFSDTDGNTINARIVSVEREEVTIEVEGKIRHFTLPKSRFSKEDRDYIKKWENDISVLVTPDDRFDVYVGTKRSKDKSGVATWRYKHEAIQPTVKFTNDDFKKDFKGITGVIAIIGVDFTDSGRFGVLDVQTFELGDVAGNTTKEWEGKEVQTSWLDDDDSYDDSYGWRYKGYSITLLNHRGEEFYRRASRSVWEKDFNSLKQLKPNQVYDTELNDTYGDMIMPTQ